MATWKRRKTNKTRYFALDHLCFTPICDTNLTRWPLFLSSFAATTSELHIAMTSSLASYIKFLLSSSFFSSFLYFSLVEGGSFEMALYLDYSEPTIPITHSRSPLPDHLAVHYRQLVSNAVTRQLLDPFLDDECARVDKSHDIFAAWEINDRMVARGSLRKEVVHLGITWGNGHPEES